MSGRFRILFLATIFLFFLSGCIVEIIKVGDFVWEDSNRNGIQDNGEVGVANVLVRFYSYDFNAGTESIIATALTDSSGYYEIEIEIPEDYFLEFIPPEGRKFTEFAQGENGQIDSDVFAPDTGRTRIFEAKENDNFDDPHIDAGLLPIERAAPVSTPTLPPAPLPTSTLPSADPFADDETEVAFEDPIFDEYLCTNFSSVTDAEVDLSTIKAEWSFGSLVVTVNRRAPLSRDFSFAVLLFINEGKLGDERVFLWELHDGVETVGELDPLTGELLPDPDGKVTITHDRQGGAIVFSIAGERLPDFVDTLDLLSFHTPVEGDEKNCDEAGPFNLPETMQKVLK